MARARIGRPRMSTGALSTLPGCSRTSRYTSAPGNFQDGGVDDRRPGSRSRSGCTQPAGSTGRRDRNRACPGSNSTERFQVGRPAGSDVMEVGDSRHGRLRRVPVVAGRGDAGQDAMPAATDVYPDSPGLARRACPPRSTGASRGRRVVCSSASCPRSSAGPPSSHWADRLTSLARTGWSSLR